MPTMIKPIDQDYKRVISAKFATTRKGDPITCRYCTNTVVIGRDFAAADGLGKWHNVCSTCSQSRPAQVTGLVTKVEALAATLTGVDLTDLAAQAGAIDTLTTAAIHGDENAARTVTPILLGILDQTRQAVTAVTTAADPINEQVEKLNGFVALGYLSGRDLTFAQSLVSQWNSRHFLSDKQRPWVTTLLDKAEAVAADIIVKPLTEAILARADGRPSLRFAIPSGGQNDLDFLAVYVGRVERHVGGVNNGEPVVYRLACAQAVTLGQRIMAMDDESFVAAQALYGQAMHQCGRCGSALTDQVSRAQGFGPDCITKNNR